MTEKIPFKKSVTVSHHVEAILGSCFAAKKSAFKEEEVNPSRMTLWEKWWGL